MKNAQFCKLSQLTIFFLASFLNINSHAFSCRSLDNDPLLKKVIDQIKSENIHLESCKDSKVHLTFDDGPSDKTTKPILDALNKRKIKATFFITTANLASGKPNINIKEQIIKNQLQSGHLIASHGHEHNSYDLRITNSREEGYSSSERKNQIAESVRLLNKATSSQFDKQSIKLFRFPYGRGAMPSQKEIEEMERMKKLIFKGESYAEKLAEYRRQSPALFQIADYNFSHLGWNLDSNDSSLPMSMPAENVVIDYVKENVQAMCNPKKDIKVALYHDIKEVNIRAIPLIADIGSCLGIDFISGQEMMAQKTSLTRDGVLISLKSTMKAPVETVDEIGKLLNDLNKQNKQCPEKKSLAKTNTNSCYSEYLKKSFNNCEGQSSICYNGKWYGKEDPTIILNCGTKY
jgi:peptidoglycan/xylan/chitin deacetylase (PgdA/CDA1 family)